MATKTDGQYVELKLSQVVPGANYRKHYDKQAMKELAASIKVDGVIEPIVVRPCSGTAGRAQYEIVVGWRRWKASGMAGRTTIPALVRKLTDKQVIAIQLAENTQREDPNPMDEAEGFKRALASGYTVESITAEIGVSQSYVYSRLKLLDLEKTCQKALLSGEINLGVALALLRVPDKAAQKELLESALDQDMSPAQVRDAVLNDYGREMTRAAFSVDGCHKCDRRSTTQEKLFADARADGGDRCMDEQCWKRKTLLALENKAAEHKAAGKPVLVGAAAISKCYQKGNILRNVERLKPRCKACADFAFFYAVDRPGRLEADFGWWCPKKACYDEVVFGMKPKEKREKQEKPQESGAGSQDPGEAGPVVPEAGGQGGAEEQHEHRVAAPLVANSDGLYATCSDCGSVFPVRMPETVMSEDKNG